MDMEQVVVLAFCAVALSPLIWVERRSRKQRRSAHPDDKTSLNREV